MGVRLNVGNTVGIRDGTIVGFRLIVGVMLGALVGSTVGGWLTEGALVGSTVADTVGISVSTPAEGCIVGRTVPSKDEPARM